MNAKTIGTILITGLIVCSAMVVFATPAMAKGDPPPGDHSVWSWAPGYCTAYYSCQDDEHLGNHSNPQMADQNDLANIDQTGVSWILNGDGTMDITVKVWTDDWGWDECLRVWIDWDGDNTFEGSEIVAEDCRQYPAIEGYTYLTFSGINIPPEAVGTTTYLRAVLDYGINLPGPCENSAWGDVEDYEITFPQEGVIPEFSTIAIPVATILGLLFFFNYRKRRKE